MRYDILHFHYHSALPIAFNYADLILWRLLGRKVIMQYEGSDIRGRSHILPRLLANSIVVTTPDLLEWEPKAVFIHAPVELTLPYIGTTLHSGPLIIVHAPSNREIKGTAHIIKAVDALKAEGFNLELDIIEKISYVEAIERYKRADIVIDQVLIGWYGYVAIECMALGKPVMVYIKDDMKQYILGTPLCFTSTTTLVGDLRGLINDTKRRGELGKAGREYVLKAHDADEVAKRMVKLYE
jgi:hypothetical protein